MPDIRVVEAGPDCLAGYARVPISFRVETEYRVEESGEGLGLVLHEEPVAVPYVKDYDSIEQPGQRVGEWPERFDMSNWRFLLAMDGEEVAGGATVLFDSPGVRMLNGRRDLGLLWDIRVRPDRRGRGVGTALWRHATDWARARGCRQFKVETSSVNVPACRFYRKMSCALGGIDRYAYRGCAETAQEVMLLFYAELGSEVMNEEAQPGVEGRDTGGRGAATGGR